MWTLNLTHQTTLIVDIDGTVFVPSGPKIQAAPDFGSYDVTGFNQFEQYLAKNGKKQPKAESVITQLVLRKYAKEILVSLP